MKRVLLALVSGLVAALVVAWYTGWVALGYYWLAIHLPQLESSANGLGLGSYRVLIDARPIAGIPENASGLTYHPLRKTLFTVINRPAQVAELDLSGNLLRTISLRGVSDVEGISHQQGNYFVIVDEGSHQMARIELDDDTREIDVAKAPRFSLAIDTGRNVGYEGVSWDHANNRLFVVKEKRPLRVFEIRGLWELMTAAKIDLHISEWQAAAPSRLMVSDLSSLTYHEPTGHLLLLSDESRLLLEFDAAGRILDLLVLRAGWHGLEKTVPQAEGVAVGDDGDVFVLSEPNLFYRFAPSRHGATSLPGHRP